MSALPRDMLHDHAGGESESRRRYADGQSLQTRAPPRHQGPQALDRSDDKENNGGRSRGQINGQGRIDDEGQQRHESAYQEGEKGTGCRFDR
jgi:hypothetical protein